MCRRPLRPHLKKPKTFPLPPLQNSWLLLASSLIRNLHSIAIAFHSCELRKSVGVTFMKIFIFVPKYLRTAAFATVRLMKRH